MSDEKTATGANTGEPETTTGASTGSASGGGTGSGTGQEDRSRWTEREWNAELERRVEAGITKSTAKLRATLEAKSRDAEAKVAALSAELAAAQSRATFADLATKAGLTDIRAGFAVARELGYFDGEKLDADAMRAAHPGLFAGAGGSPKNTGAGSGSTNPGAPLSFNDAIRARVRG